LCANVACWFPQAQRSAKGRIVLFRPDRNADRMRDGAARMLMPAPPAELFMRAVREVVAANQVGGILRFRKLKR
jgi:branched-subunit amino acid aminotransferase/4-amino-4-deoxychorismate lyase